METVTFSIGSQHDGAAIREYLRRHLQLSVRTVTELKQLPEGILLNGRPGKTSDLLHTGDVLRLVTDAGERVCSFENSPFPVLYEDRNFAAFEKPPNVTVYRCGKVEREMYGALKESCGEFQFRPFYRLDKNTSGILLTAKNAFVMHSTQIEKEYFAFCEGETPEQGEIRVPIGLRENSKILRQAGVGEEAATKFERLSFQNGVSLVRCKLETGRTHQIRVHMAYLGHPVCGDDLYGGGVGRIGRQALHCGYCRVRSQAVGTEFTIVSPFPEDIRKAFPEFCSDR